jgi:hypothetical protein
VAVPRNSDWMMVEAVSSSDMAVCFKKDPGKKGLIVASVYMDITKSIHSRELSSLLEYCDRMDPTWSFVQTPMPTPICGGVRSPTKGERT